MGHGLWVVEISKGNVKIIDTTNVSYGNLPRKEFEQFFGVPLDEVIPVYFDGTCPFLFYDENSKENKIEAEHPKFKELVRKQDKIRNLLKKQSGLKEIMTIEDEPKIRGAISKFEGSWLGTFVMYWLNGYYLFLD